MPNYRLTHKITGTTVPATAGYYGAHNQSTTKWKMAGSEMYAWKSDDFANAYFMGATIDADAFKTVTISGAVDTAFNGAYVYSSTVSKWLKSTTHSIYKDGTTWKLTDGTIIYTAADNGLNIPPSAFSRTLDYPLTITVVAPSGVSAVLGEYAYAGTYVADPYWKRGNYSINKEYLTWAIANDLTVDFVYSCGTGSLPAKTGLTLASEGSEPVPTLEYSLISSCSLSVTSSAKFAATSLSGTWYPVNGGTGTPVFSEYSIGEAWETAEKTVFDSLKAWLGGTESKDCFRGYLPFQNVEKKFVDVWMLTSGGTAGAFDIERTYGMNGAWCNVMQNADVEAIFENRTTAMQFTGAVLAWIKSTNNFNQTANVNWCRLRNLPEAPKEIIEGNRRFWEVKIPLEMLYLTEGVYA